ncbi:shufflon system plasmid conjugative transfer pilus tip adhesin PilV [Enterobacter roggenkampii]|nr:shufflon system plasmid conjugative transfer pilus tip adhesin PilV [Enterobacter roggenkampii]EIZ9682045.1 shufflon system plasmid conjugative transfer pilus tip adhesin PilV [Cronobacter sakazakii]PSF22205.1 shufflon system plasmid conjugative transfer pilus tip adhesin PilV [Escherichia coli]EIZ9687487.1 shufflon system plasmid conjugative transfer pilus tip adhesin PilV [Cronobacter sakazakii]EKY3956441.1 shufflon system plasmid conjugative transfer pilus tip adhesin PilV [Enterobacter r
MKKGVAQMSDALGAIGLLLVVLAVIILPMSSWILDQSRATVAASQAKKVQQAVNLYIKDNHDTIAASATATTPFIFGVPELISGGYLPTGFSSQNNFSATYQTRVFEPTANKLNSMTFLNGGVQLSKSLARKIAIGIGSDGGIIDNGVAQGALGSWTMSLASFGGYNPGDGSVVIAGFYEDGNNISDYLYRKAVPGHPELNTMSTALNMGAKDINNAATTTTTTLNATNANATTVTATDVNSTNVNATNVNAQTTRTAGETYTGGWFRTTGDTGWYNEKWGGGFNMTDSTWIRAYNNKSIYTGGQVQAGTILSNGRMTANEFVQLNGVATAGAACSPNGLIGRDAAGGILSCQSGVWSAAAGKPKLSTFTLTHYGSSFNYSNVGIHDFCTSQYGNENDRDDSWRGVQLLGDGSWQIAVKDGSETIMCLDW